MSEKIHFVMMLFEYGSSVDSRGMPAFMASLRCPHTDKQSNSEAMRI